MVRESTPLFLLIIDAIAFWLRSQSVFWLLALPIAGLAAAVAYILDSSNPLSFQRYRRCWEFLCARITRCSARTGGAPISGHAPETACKYLS
jgi:hypothetical protein